MAIRSLLLSLLLLAGCATAGPGDARDCAEAGDWEARVW